ncbi:Ubiquinol-cytochrome-c reductase complex assembly factor 3 [Nibea albiflora]|uniref:Ubiquinol-cytochrome-c reductase complex assembly factor 3 n=1 Tax=Nibea albiflora TaxID=240163 RepID=A0ACB7FAZ0_NIBAL|nr:Ubiquinol-cytochrome-c reductase complex assembly factor 3 [Nibea albiflora]
MSGLRTILSTSAVIVCVGAGCGLWALVVPGEEKKREFHKNLPESNPVRMEETRKRNALVMQAIKEAAETNENVARGIGQSVK